MMCQRIGLPPISTIGLAAFPPSRPPRRGPPSCRGGGGRPPPPPPAAGPPAAGGGAPPARPPPPPPPPGVCWAPPPFSLPPPSPPPPPGRGRRGGGAAPPGAPPGGGAGGRTQARGGRLCSPGVRSRPRRPRAPAARAALDRVVQREQNAEPSEQPELTPPGREDEGMEEGGDSEGERTDRARPGEHVALDVRIEALDAIVQQELVRSGRASETQRQHGERDADPQQPLTQHGLEP